MRIVNIYKHNMLIRLVEIIQYYVYLNKYYIKSAHFGVSSKKVFIYMADGRFIHGGLSDRLRGMCSLYQYCKNHNIPFKINFIHPFDIRFFLIPNVYDWTINAGDIVYDRNSAAIIIKPNSDNNIRKRLSKLSKEVQYHLYANCSYNISEFGNNFNELFSPTELLRDAIDLHLKKIGNPYVSITFRFQNLLGDFKERKSKEESQEQQLNLIEACLEAIENVKNRHLDVPSILITSDSRKFLLIAKEKFNYVYFAEGNLLHMDCSNSSDVSSYLKSFVDLFLISKAKKAYSFARGKMYFNSGFAKTAALIGGIECENI